MSQQQGLLVIFSGLDGAGKSTQIQILMGYLRQTGQQPSCIWTRGGYTPALERLKQLARKVLKGGLPPSGHSTERQRAFQKTYMRRLWLVASILDLMWLYGVKIRLLRRGGRVVICDRYLSDTLVDFRLNFPQDQIERWWLWRGLARMTPTPDAIFWMWVPVEESVRRSAIKGEPFPDSSIVLTQRLSEYETLAALHGWQSLDGRRPIADLADEIRSTVDQIAEVRNRSHSQASSSGLSG